MYETSSLYPFQLSGMILMSVSMISLVESMFEFLHDIAYTVHNISRPRSKVVKVENSQGKVFAKGIESQPR